VSSQIVFLAFAAVANGATTKRNANDNKQFHHTTTAEDGVKLGCYGHELGDKKYATFYVNDFKGYRLVPHETVVTVYPKDGSEPR
jgi:hypothetical protein